MVESRVASARAEFGEAELTVLLRSVREAVILVDHEALVRDFNPAAEFLTARRVEEVLDRPVAEVVDLAMPDGSGVGEALAAPGPDEGRAIHLPDGTTLETADGRGLPVSGVLAPLFDGKMRTGTVFVLRDATPEAYLGDARRTRADLFRRLHEGKVWGTFVFDADGMITEADSTFADLLGYETTDDVVGTSFRSLLPIPVEYQYLSALVRSSGRVSARRRSLRCHEEGRVHVVMSLRHRPEDDTVMGSVLDLSELRVIDERVARARRLEDIALMAGGVANEVGDLMAVVRGQVNLLRETGATDAVVALDVAVDRARALVDRLLAVGHARETEREVIHLADTLRSWHASIRRAAHPARVALKFSATDWWVSVDRSLLQEVVLALIENAGQATGEGETPVTLRLVEPSNTPVDELGPGRPLVGVRVDDQGGGMPPDVALRAIEAFYSTWPDHLGLGLSAAHGFAQQNGGSLRLVNRPGLGVTAILYLPLVGPPDGLDDEPTRGS